MTEETSDEIIQRFESHIEQLHETYKTLTDMLNSRIESLEQQVSILIVGYGEQATIMDALANQVYEENPTPETFEEAIKKSRKEMMGVLEKYGQGGGVAENNPENEPSVEHATPTDNSA